MATTIEIDIDLLTQQVSEGKKREELAQYWGLNISQMKNALTAAGLKIRKFHAPAFKLVSKKDTEEIVEETITDTQGEMTQGPGNVEEVVNDSTTEHVDVAEPEVTWKH